MGVAILDAALPPNLTRYNQRATLVLAADGSVLDADLARDGRWRFAISAHEVEPQYLSLLKRIEDKRFSYHPGVDPLAALRALWQVASQGEVVSGASTLTMQTARLLEPRPRTLASKLIEMARAVQLSLHYSKADILGIYLTLAPYGGNIEGLRAASLMWLGKEPAQLNLAEAALLVALPQSPERLRPDRHPIAAKAARNRILTLAANTGLITQLQADEAKQANLPTRLIRLPDLAPHFTARLVQRQRGAVIRTTLDRELQQGLAELLTRSLRPHEPEVTMASMVIESRTGAVRAYVGNATVNDAVKRGMVDIIPAIRSPGSTLKPFIYAMGFDRLIVHPNTVITDMPLRFGAYAPENFSGGFNGEVTVTEALQRSLNLPAVALLDRIGPVALDTALNDAGVQLRFDRRLGKPTLPIALGGVGISLENLVRLFASIPNGGQTPVINFTPQEPASRHLMTPASAWYLARILEGAPRPEGYNDARISNGPVVAYKTGTSYGYRDAWSIGFSGDYTLGVWVGRADGTPCARCVGLQAAAPVLLQAANLLPAPQNQSSGAIPEGVWQARGARLPPSLQRFSLKNAGNTHARAATILTPPLRLVFPLDDTMVEISEGTTELPLRAEGGQRPLRWLVNGEPLSSDSISREARWPITGNGFARITVQDATGASASAMAWLQAEE